MGLHNASTSPTKPAGFCQFYKIIKMIIKSIKVSVEWKFYTRLIGPGPDLADSWLGPVTARERERQPPSAASRPLLSISETKLGTEWNDTNVSITRLWSLTLCNTRSTAKWRTRPGSGLAQGPVSESWIGKLCFDNLIDGKTYLQHNLGSIKNKLRIKIFDAHETFVKYFYD
mgnify:CR=1 FL=1